MKIRNGFGYVVLSFAGAILAGCGDSATPSDSTVSSVLKSYISEQVKGFADVQNVSKTDGLARPDGSYIADYVAQVKVTECAFYRGNWEFSNFQPWGCFAKPGEVAITQQYVPQVGVGHVLEVKGKAVFVKKESGWAATDVSSEKLK